MQLFTIAQAALSSCLGMRQYDNSGQSQVVIHPTETTISVAETRKDLQVVTLPFWDPNSYFFKYVGSWVLGSAHLF